MLGSESVHSTLALGQIVKGNVIENFLHDGCVLENLAILFWVFNAPLHSVPDVFIPLYNSLCKPLVPGVPLVPALLCNFIEISLRHGCSPVNLLHIFRTPFPKNTSGELFLCCKHLLLAFTTFVILGCGVKKYCKEVLYSWKWGKRINWILEILLGKYLFKVSSKDTRVIS